MKIQIKKQEDKAPEGFKRGQLLEGERGGIYICSKDQAVNLVDVIVIHPENIYEEPGKLMDECSAYVFKLFTGEITLSND
jgi:hypothetical protein